MRTWTEKLNVEKKLPAESSFCANTDKKKGFNQSDDPVSK